MTTLNRVLVAIAAGFLFFTTTMTAGAQVVARQTVTESGSLRLGEAVAIDGAVAVVASRAETVGANSNPGAVYVYTRSGSNWVRTQRLVAPDGGPFHDFGTSVAVSGTTMLIGAVAAGPSGSVYVFGWNGASWTFQTKLTPTDLTATHYIGNAVSLQGDTAVIGARGRSPGFGQPAPPGAAYVFERTGGTWSQAGKLVDAAGEGVDMFGWSVGVSNGTACVGAPQDLVGSVVFKGSVSVFARGAGGWGFQAKLTAADGLRESKLGSSCVVDGDTLATGASWQDAPPLRKVGSVYVFVRTGTSWSLQQRLDPSDVNSEKLMGDNLALEGNLLVAGAQLDPASPTSGPIGSAYVFERSGTTWTERQKLRPVAAPAGYFGTGVAIDGSWFVIGAPLNAGQAVFFERTATAAPPGAPTSFAATADGNNVNMTWSAPASGGAATSYTILARVAPGGPVIASLPVGLTTSFGVGAPNGTFVLSVRATNASGPGPESTTVTVTVPQAVPPPGPPSNLAVTVVGNTATFSWTPPSGGGAATSYMLFAGVTPGFAVPIASLPLPNTPGTVVGGIPAGTYYARVIAINGGGMSPPSNDVTIVVAGAAPPGPPVMNPAGVSGGTVSLSWSAGPGGVPTGYTLYASMTPGGAPIATVPLAGPGLVVPAVPPGTYFIRVTASNGAGTSAASNEIAFTVP